MIVTKVIALSQGKVAVVDNEDYEWLNQWKWSALKSRATWYAVRQDYSGNKQKTIYMHRQILNSHPGQKTHHLNGDGLDNRRANILRCNRSEHAKIHQRKPEHTVWDQSMGPIEEGEVNFGKRLKTLRVARGLLQKELAALTRIPDVIISRMETGKVLPGPEWERKLRDTLGWDDLVDKAFEILESEPEAIRESG